MATQGIALFVSDDANLSATENLSRLIHVSLVIPIDVGTMLDGTISLASKICIRSRT
jgi:hypothetical protein